MSGTKDPGMRPRPRRRCRRHTFRFRSITFEGMHGFHSKSVDVYIIEKYRSFDIGNHPPNFG